MMDMMVGATKFCDAHWKNLRDAIDARGLTPLVPKSGAEAIARAADVLTESEGKLTRANYDPLSMAMFAIIKNLLGMIARHQGPEAVLQMMSGGCPICWANKRHDETCTDPTCQAPKGKMADWMIERAAEDELLLATEMGLVAPLSKTRH